MELKPSIRHIFTHFKAEINVFLSQVETTDSKNWDDKFRFKNLTDNEEQKMPEFEWKAEEELHLPKLMDKALRATSNF